ncbi:methyltransferase-related family protein [Striga asiatica]|uniref:Methyltransferase-related family protein n=1 Tax=Striga asiatica TaxID=4170 RepID=A0A5A7PLQ3_STRAF|nr:methyltransferase-related family protein [Striga asiatica]
MAIAAQPAIRIQQNSTFFPMNLNLVRNSQLRPLAVCPPGRIRAISAVTMQPESITEAKDTSAADLFACPICYEPLIRKGPPGFNVSGFKCKKCNKSYSSKNIYLDLTVTSGTKEYNEFKPTGTELFRSPLVSFVYERGWRQNFSRSGFPGPDEEFNMAQEYFKPSEGGFLVDVSCGSGLFSRKFAKSGAYSRVVALDFSENMLRQCFEFIKNEDAILRSSASPSSSTFLYVCYRCKCVIFLITLALDKNDTKSNLALVRADVSRLPFSSGSVDAVHAGAALHCWPSPSNAVAEINRILRSGGVFVGSTFLRVTSSTPAFLRPLRQIGNNYNYLTEEEIEDLCSSCGLVNYTKKVQQSFIIFSAQKP